jgi:hypothetical protein
MSYELLLTKDRCAEGQRTWAEFREQTRSHKRLERSS